MPRIPLGTEQALLFRRGNQKQNRPSRFLSRRQARKDTRDFQNRGHASRVIEGTVVNRIAFLIRRADAEMIPMRYDKLITEFRIATRKDRDDIRRLDTFDFTIKID